MIVYTTRQHFKKSNHYYAWHESGCKLVHSQSWHHLTAIGMECDPSPSYLLYFAATTFKNLGPLRPKLRVIELPAVTVGQRRKICQSRNVRKKCQLIACITFLYTSKYQPCRIRPYSTEYTRSRSISEVKQSQAGLVLGWVTAWEFPVPYPFTLRPILS